MPLLWAYMWISHRLQYSNSIEMNNHSKHCSGRVYECICIIKGARYIIFVIAVNAVLQYVSMRPTSWWPQPSLRDDEATFNHTTIYICTDYLIAQHARGEDIISTVNILYTYTYADKYDKQDSEVANQQPLNCTNCFMGPQQSLRSYNFICTLYCCKDTTA
jgi:hypothetical protein